MKYVFLLAITFCFCSFGSNKEKLAYKLGSTWINIERIRYAGESSLIIVHVHDNEETARQVAQEVLSQKGGLLLTINNNKERYVSFQYGSVKYAFDPNRIYTPEGRKATLKAQSTYSRSAAIRLQRFAAYFLKTIPRAQTIIAVHNNTNESYSILSYLEGGDYQKDALYVHHNPEQDADDFFLTTSLTLYNKIKEKGYNVVLQDNKNAANDGSMSVYYGKRGKAYVNVEAEHGHKEQQVKMLNDLAEMLR